MDDRSYPDDWYDIDTELYDRSVKVFRSLQKMLSVKLKLHGKKQVKQGDIFLFNHFSRFETFIPQFLIFEESGAYSCAIASGEFFRSDNVLSRYLSHVGVFPHNHHNLFPLLATHILKGRKVIIFPEGGMVKDRRVMDKHGQFSILSRIKGERRKHHTGAAVLAQGLEAFKATVRNTYSKKDYTQLEQWKQSMGLESLEQLLVSALRPTLIVPANITFYPIRSSENVLQQGVELFADGLSFRQTEELIIEGNILLKDTDMDIRMGKPVDPYQVWHWWNRYLLEFVASEFTSLEEVFSLHSSPKNWRQKLLGAYFKKSARDTRNQYMQDIYSNVTINLSHLAATLIMHFIDQKQLQIEKYRFYTALYIAVKLLQKNTQIYLHGSLLNPDAYSDLVAGTNKRFRHFIDSAIEHELIIEHEDCYQFLPKLIKEYDIDSVRLENLIIVYYNEAEPISFIRQTVIKALSEFDKITTKQLAQWHFEDELRALNWEKKFFSKPRFDDINKQETFNADPKPFLLTPKNANGIGILLIHGLLASPAELKNYADYLTLQGYTVLGIRLKGHGSSPYALGVQDWQDWYGSVQRGCKILNHLCHSTILIGFSTGGALALKMAATKEEKILAIVAVAVPLKFVDKTMMLVPIIHSSNKFVEGISAFKGVKSFIENDPEHPKINYRNIPIKSLYELKKLTQDMENVLPDIDIPTQVIFADKDPVVDYSSAEVIFNKLGSSHKQCKTINADRHGILMENTNDTWAVIDDFLNDINSQRKFTTPS